MYVNVCTYVCMCIRCIKRFTVAYFTADNQLVSLSHVIVLPPDPSAVTSGSVTTPVATDFSTEDMMVLNADDSGAGGDMGG